MAWRGSRPVGYAWVATEMRPEVSHCPLELPADAAYLWDLYVVPAERGSGVGSALASERLRAARALGRTEGWRMITPDNAASLGTLRRSGASTRVVGRMRYLKLGSRLFARFTPCLPAPPLSLDVVLFTSNLLGIEVAAAVAGLAEVRSLHVITTSLPRPRTMLERVKKTYRFAGPAGLIASTRARLPGPFAPAAGSTAGRRARPAGAIRGAPALPRPARAGMPVASPLAPAGSRPRLRLLSPPTDAVRHPASRHAEPPSREAARVPGFVARVLRALAGVPEIGVTVHRVDDGLDSGPILLQRGFPLDVAPDGRPDALSRQAPAGGAGSRRRGDDGGGRQARGPRRGGRGAAGCGRRPAPSASDLGAAARAEEGGGWPASG